MKREQHLERRQRHYRIREIFTTTEAIALPLREKAGTNLTWEEERTCSFRFKSGALACT
jgi:hypothetical protein